MWGILKLSIPEFHSVGASRLVTHEPEHFSLKGKINLIHAGVPVSIKCTVGDSDEEKFDFNFLSHLFPKYKVLLIYTWTCQK